MTGPLDRASLLLCVPFALVAASAFATTVPDSRGAWTKAAVPIELRGRVHMSAREVPRFPEDDPKLMHLKGWPAKRRIEGWDCKLDVRSSYFDGRRPLQVGIKPTSSAHYLCRPRWWPWGKPQARGPWYVWTLDGQLLERAYTRARRDMVIYQVDRAGRLVGFEDWKHQTTEYFDVDGALIAGEYGTGGRDETWAEYRQHLFSVWQGERVTHEEFMRRLSGLLRDMASRY